MKILYLSAAILPSEISHSLSIMRVCQAFTDNGHDVTLTGIAPTKDAPDPIKFYGFKGGFKVIRHLLPFWAKKNPIASRLLLPGLVLGWKTRKLCNQIKPDIIYSRLTITELAFVPRDIPIIYEMHSLGPFGISFIHRWAFRWILRRKNFKRIVVTTNVLAEWLKDRIPDAEITVARLSAEPPVELTQKQISAFVNDNFQGHNFKQHVGYTGYLDTEGLRGTDIIIQTAARMPDIAFHIVGGKPEIVEHWKKYAEDYNQAGNIFFYGYRNPNEMPYFLGGFDVTLAPLQHRPTKRAPIGKNMSPLKLPQYMGYGKAIVASDLPAHREVLSEGETALMVRHDDIDAWVSSIQSLLDNENKRRAMAKAGKKAYASEFTPRIRIQKMLSGLPTK